MLDQFKGGTIKDNSFVSTSANPILNAFNYYPMQLEIQALAGTHAYITDNFKETEVILHKPTLCLKGFSSYDYKDEFNLDDNGDPIIEKRLKVIFGVEEDGEQKSRRSPARSDKKQKPKAEDRFIAQDVEVDSRIQATRENAKAVMAKLKL